MTAVPPPLRVGISACLIGQPVRFDGGHRRHPWLVQVLGRFVEWVPVCPEMEIGLGAPRPTLALRRREGRIQMWMAERERDYAPALRAWSGTRLGELAEAGLSAYVFKARSPSCGLGHVPIESGAGEVEAVGRGRFAAAFVRRFPLVAVAEETELEQTEWRERWIVSMFAASRIHALLARGASHAGLARLAREHALLVTAHAPRRAHRILALATSGSGSPELLARRWGRALLAALAQPVRPAGRCAVWRQILRDLGPRLPSEERERLGAAGRRRAARERPDDSVGAALAECLHRRGIEYREGRWLLDPDPRERALLVRDGLSPATSQ